jgi:hypothetical protein
LAEPEACFVIAIALPLGLTRVLLTATPSWLGRRETRSCPRACVPQSLWHQSASSPLKCQVSGPDRGCRGCTVGVPATGCASTRCCRRSWRLLWDRRGYPHPPSSRRRSMRCLRRDKVVSVLTLRQGGQERYKERTAQRRATPLRLTPHLVQSESALCRRDRGRHVDHKYTWL